MNWFRVWHTIGMCLTLSPMKRAEYLKKHDILRHVGTNCMVMFRKVPLYPRLISLGNNVWIASQVSFIMHDVIHYMVNYCIPGERLKENIGCIDIKDNVFIGSNTSILPDVSIGPNVIIGAGSVINRSVQNGVYAGVPVKYICSWDDFINRREKSEQLDVAYGKKGGLSDKTIEACWKRFKEKEDRVGIELEKRC